MWGSWSESPPFPGAKEARSRRVAGLGSHPAHGRSGRFSKAKMKCDLQTPKKLLSSLSIGVPTSSTHPLSYLFVHSSTHLSIHPPICLSLHPSIYPSIHLSIHPPHLLIHPHIHPFTYLLIHSSIPPSIHSMDPSHAHSSRHPSKRKMEKEMSKRRNNATIQSLLFAHAVIQAQCGH